MVVVGCCLSDCLVVFGCLFWIGLDWRWLVGWVGLGMVCLVGGYTFSWLGLLVWVMFVLGGFVCLFEFAVGCLDCVVCGFSWWWVWCLMVGEWLVVVIGV